jgi:hypothetical protein
LLYDSTSTETEKCVRKMCLFLMVEERMDIYTLIRNSVVSYAMRDGEYAAVHTVETKGARHDLDSWG